MAPQGSGWELGGAASQASVKVAPGEPGIDSTTPGVTEIGGDVATSVELGPSNVLVDGWEEGRGVVPMSLHPQPNLTPCPDFVVGDEAIFLGLPIRVTETAL